MQTAVVCVGEVTQVDSSTLNCSDAWVVQTQYAGDLQLDPVLFAGAVGAGFFCLVPIWAAVIGGKYLLKAISGRLR